MIKVIKSSGIATDALKTSDKKYNAFMLISIDSNAIDYSKSGIKEYCDWVFKYFDNFLLFIIDLPQMYNYRVFKNISLVEAKQKAESAGQNKIRALDKVLRGFNINKAFTQGFNDINKNKQYKSIRSIIQDYFNQNDIFKNDLIIEMRKIIFKRPLEDDIERDDNLANFLIDEISAYLYFTEFANYPIEIAHHDEFEIIKNIYSSKYDNLLSELKLKGNTGFIQTEIAK